MTASDAQPEAAPIHRWVTEQHIGYDLVWLIKMRIKLLPHKFDFTRQTGRSMSRSHPHARHAESIVASLLAGGFALSYAWIVSGTRYVTTGLQFVAPLAIILFVHLALLAARWGLARGFSATVLSRTLATAIGIVG